MSVVTLKGDTTPDITKIIEGGEDKVKVYHKVVESQPASGESVAFEAGDIIAYLSDLGEFGASKETKEVTLYHLKNKAKLTTGSSIKDLSVTEALTKAGMENIKAAYKANAYIVTAMFDSAGNQLYGCFGSISDWGSTIPNGDTCTLTYTLALTDDEVTCTEPVA